MNRPLTRRFFLYSSGTVSLSWLALPQMVRAQLAPQLPLVRGVEMQPLIAQVKRLLEATEYLGMPLAAQDKAAVQAALRVTDANVAGEAIQSVLDREHRLRNGVRSRLFLRHCVRLIAVSTRGAPRPSF